MSKSKTQATATVIEEIAMDEDHSNNERTVNDVDKVYTMVTNLLQAAEGPPDGDKSQTENIYGVITGLHVCDICKKEYANISNLNRHLKKIHKEDVHSVRAKIRCPSCEFGCEFYGTLCRHLEECHSIRIERENLVFESEDAFFNWKKKMEKTTKASFIKKCGRKKTKQTQVEKIYFYCHRSGEKLKRPTMGKRQMKAQGSCKMNSGCPAQITVLKHTGKFPVLEVEFVKTHVGHAMDMRHIRLDSDEKAKLASQLAKGVPLDRVLDSVKKPNENDAPTERIQLTTRKDLLNISKQFHIHNKNANLDDDIAAIDLWVRQVYPGDDSPILCYKPGGEVCDDYPTLSAEDLLLGIMNTTQIDMLARHGENLICIDRTHVSNGFDFPLVTLMVVDENDRAFPAVFFISNKQDDNMMGVFFEQIKNKMGRLKPKTFMTDTGRVFYNSWKHVMGAVVEKLFCSWHVEASWKKKVQLIKELDLQVDIFKALKVLLEEDKVESFQEKMDALLCTWQMDEKTKRFGRYFQQHFASYASFWAKCHRKGCSNAVNESLESLHQRLKMVYFEDSLKVKKMDKAIAALMKVLRELEIERGQFDEGELEIKKKIAVVLERHDQSEVIPANNVIAVDNGGQLLYFVKSSSHSEQYHVVQVEIDNCQCSLICPRCSTCVHKLKCTCADHSVQGNMCKHIHAVCDKARNQTPTAVAIATTSISENDMEENIANVLVEETLTVGNENLIKNTDGQQIMMLADDQDLLHIATDQSASVITGDVESITSGCQDEQILVRVFSSGNTSSSTFNQEKKVLEDKAEQLLSKIKTCRSWDELNNIKHLIMPLESAVEMVMDTENEETVMLDTNNLQTFIVTEKTC